MLKAIGFWIEDIEDEIRPAPQELVGAMPRERRKLLANYLTAGVASMGFFGSSWCRFGCGIDDRLMGSHDLTDGVWLWPEGLAHYVEHHGVMLPPDFTDFALARGSPRKPGPIREGLEGTDSDREEELVDYEYWQQWCASGRSPNTLERLHEARTAAAARAQTESAAKRSAAVTKLIAERGQTDSNCIRRGCRLKALMGGYLCAEHSVNESDVYVSTRPVFSEFLTGLSRAHGLKANFQPRKPSYASRMRKGLNRLIGRRPSMFKTVKRPR